jgi:hypothetical protein
MTVRDLRQPAPLPPLRPPRRLAVVGFMTGVLHGAVKGALALALVAAVFCLFSWDSPAVSLQDDFLPLIFVGACGGGVLGAAVGGARSGGADPGKGRMVGTGLLVALGPALGVLAGAAGQWVVLADGALVGAAGGALFLLRKRGAGGRVLGTLIGAGAGLLIGTLINTGYRPGSAQIEEILTWSQRIGAGAGACFGACLLLQGWPRFGALLGVVVGGTLLGSVGNSVGTTWQSLEGETFSSPLAHTLFLVGAWAGASIASMLGAALVRCLWPAKSL